MPKRKSAYTRAGVDIDEMNTALKRAKRLIRSTATQGVIGNIGSFGGLFAAPGKDDVLVASTDGVGTKLKVAVMANRHDTVGQDIVNHCANDILAQGARPLFFLDYLGTAKLGADMFQSIIRGLAKACRENGCALLGGETAEMPGLYPPGEYDLVGTIIGAVRKQDIITGESIRTGDLLIGLPSTGLHTNGYSLARKVVFEKAKLRINSRFPGTRRRVADVLLDVHRSYVAPVQAVMQKVRIHGIAHITGGGLIDNVPRILPENTTAVFDCAAWRVPPVFTFIEEQGEVDRLEMYRVFNMGIGLVLAVRPADADAALTVLRRHKEKPIVIGRIEKGKAGVRLLNAGR
ncbi:MAG: phosphoribosylformylglycinamidine cyclo-ligase [Kiritimatiellae bacterium]|nr:phosphoribosylformylglycinamidine cyclo-ligase [Kiritimatiellia bacterium]